MLRLRCSMFMLLAFFLSLFFIWCTLIGLRPNWMYCGFFWTLLSAFPIFTDRISPMGMHWDYIKRNTVHHFWCQKKRKSAVSTVQLLTYCTKTLTLNEMSIQFHYSKARSYLAGLILTTRWHVICQCYVISLSVSSLLFSTYFIKFVEIYIEDIKFK